MKISNAILFFVFAAFAYLNLNDPDPWLWFAIYLAVSLICIFRVFGFYRRKLVINMFIVLLIFSITLVPGFAEWLVQDDKSALFEEMTDDKPYVEETREFLGLILALLALVSQFIWRSKSSQKAL
ncbi:MAG: transmembrane 220 family protein [Bacteroidota bacterium]